MFKHLFAHIKQDYFKNEKAIKKKINSAALTPDGISAADDSQALLKFMVVFEQFTKEVETDINKGVQLLNIDYYMRDLKKHALEEYQEVL